MKKIWIILMIFFTMSCFTVSCFAEEQEDYNNSFSLIGGEELFEIIDENTREFFIKNDIDIEDYSWVNKLSVNNIFVCISDMIKSGIKGPVKTGVAVLTVVILMAGFTSFDVRGSVNKTVMMACSLLITLLLANDIWNCISASVSTIKYLSGFMIAFIPIFILSASLSGLAVSAASSSGVLLLSASAVSFFASNYALPVLGGYLSLSLISSVSPFDAIGELADTIKKAVNWTLTFVFTIFVGILSIQNSVNSATDSFALKTAKFIMGTCIPVAGTALSESASSVYSSMNLLKSSVGIYGIIVVAAAVVPILTQIFIWKGILAVSASISKVFSQKSVFLVLTAINSLLSVLLSIMLFTGGLFIISLGIVVSVKAV